MKQNWNLSQYLHVLMISQGVMVMELVNPKLLVLRLAAFLALVVMSAESKGVTLIGKVVAIADGDTVTVLDVTNTQHRIRLSGIDAPERGQDRWRVSKQYLSNRVFSQQVAVEYNKTDRYGRVVGRVLRDGEDINLELLQVGGAWFYWKYAKELPAGLRESYPAAEAAARVQRRGLWQSTSPVPPWEWRQRGRKKITKEGQ